MDVKEGERVWISVTAIVRITLQDGCSHEDVGHGHCENMKGRAAAIEKAGLHLTAQLTCRHRKKPSPMRPNVL